MRRTYVVLVILALVATTISIADAEQYPNEAILELKAVFTGTSDNITLKVYATVNDAARAQGDLKYRLTIDTHIIDENITTTEITEGYQVEWDSDVFTGEYHTITLEFVNPNEDISTANTADNQLSLGIATPGSSIGILLNAYGQLEYTITKIARQSVNGAFAFITAYPLYVWILILLIIIGIAWFILKRRKNNRNIIPPRYKGYIRL